jgi:hypothetical protein
MLFNKTKGFAPNRIQDCFATFAVVYGPALILLGLTIVANVYKGTPFRFFSADPTATLGGHPLTGMQSNLGVLAWSATGAICLFAHTILRARQASSFFLWSGVITIALALDDFFHLHEFFAPRYLSIKEEIVYIAYGSAITWYLIKFRERILDSKFYLLFLAFGFFALSVLIDLLQTRWPSHWRIFFEDGFKLLGIVSWSGYLIRACFEAIEASIMSGAATSSYSSTAPCLGRSHEKAARQ